MDGRFFVCGFEGIYTDGMRETVPVGIVFCNIQVMVQQDILRIF